jgi:ABC-2 type transport system permease protein
MTNLTGTGALIRFGVRRGWVRILVWIGGSIALVAITVQSTVGLLSEPEALARTAAQAEANKALLALQGPNQALDTLGGQIAWQLSMFALILVSLMCVFMIGFLTRAEEESGRTELLLATPVGRHAPLAAALVIVTAMNLLVAAGTLVSLALVDIPFAGSVALALGLVAMGFVFTAFGALVAQVTENTRVVYGASGALLGIAFILRAVGDVGDGTLSWLSPIGWSQKMRPYAGERWWALAVPAVATVALGIAAWVLANHRDVSAGLVPPRPGRPNAAGSLGTPFGLALRLQRGSLIAWSAAVFLGGVSYGSVANVVDEFVQDSPEMADMIARFSGASVLDSFFATTMVMLALISSGFAIQSALRLHTEENTLRAEPLLATRLARPTWVVSHVVISIVGTAVVVALGGLGMALTYGIIAGDLASLPRLVAASLAYVPAAWVLAGIAVALFGLVPRLSLATWAALAVAAVVSFLGQLIQLPEWSFNLSPFEHVPQVPARSFEALPVVLLSAIALVLVIAGIGGFRRRDTPV